MRRPAALLSLLFVISHSVVMAPSATAAACAPAEAQASTTHDVFSSFDGTPIAVTLFKPSGACSGAPTPAILDFHGWANSRAKVPDGEIQAFLNAGYGVVSVDARGHGESGGATLIMQPDGEVRDFRTMIDWLYDEVGWIQREASATPKDLVLGGNGASYGGAAQLMLAAHDDRLDAIAPGRTWNDLTRALFPSEVVEKVWASLLFLGAARSETSVDQSLQQWLATALATDRWPDEALATMTRSSPSTWLDEVDIPTLLVQGMNDTLFDLEEATRTAVRLRDAGVPAKVFGIQTGHELPTQPTGLAGPRPSMGPCWGGAAMKLTLYDAYLRGDAAAQQRFDQMPFVTVPTEEGTCLTGTWPLATASDVSAIGPTAVPPGGGGVLIPVLGPGDRAVVVGSPHLSMRLVGPTGQVVYASLVLRNARTVHVVYDQVTPIRTVTALQGAMEVDLAPVAADIGPGEQLFLRLESANDQFAGVRGGTGPTVVLSGSLALPTL